MADRKANMPSADFASKYPNAVNRDGYNPVSKLEASGGRIAESTSMYKIDSSFPSQGTLQPAHLGSQSDVPTKDSD
jgi:hypothetical protein